MDAYITKIRIEELRHLHNIEISLSQNEKKHLIITGKNGSGKTTLLNAIRDYLVAINDGVLNKLKSDYMNWLNNSKIDLSKATESNKAELKKNYDIFLQQVDRYKKGIDIEFMNETCIDTLFEEGNFITAFYAADRKTSMFMPTGVEKVSLKEKYGINESAGTAFVKYMLHLKTQQSYATIEHDHELDGKIQDWFDRLEKFLKIILDKDDIKLDFDYKNYNFTICEGGRDPFGFNELSDGYSAVIEILADLMLRMENDWLKNKDAINLCDKQGIVLIDELETHLHVELQKKILPALITIFPNIQFIVSTHSPYVLSSVENAVGYDLEHQESIENMWLYTADQLAESYFDTEGFSARLRDEVARYNELVKTTQPTDEERAERARLRIKLKNTMNNSTLTSILEDIEDDKN